MDPFSTVGSVLTNTSIINPRTYMQIHTPIVVQVGGGGGEGWMEPLPGVFDIYMLQHFKTILPLQEPLVGGIHVQGLRMNKKNSHFHQ